MKLQLTTDQVKALYNVTKGNPLKPEESKDLNLIRELLTMELESEFLKECGFDVSDGFFNTDVNYYKSKNPSLFKKYFS